MLIHRPWADLSGLRHGFLDAQDCRQAPDWAAVMDEVGVDLPLRRPRQVHGAVVLASDDLAPASEADGVVTGRRRVAVGVVTADCVPVLMRDCRGRAVAAVHAGWRGAAAGVIEAALATMTQVAGVQAADVEAVLGPAVGGCCYEVGGDVRDALLARSSGAASAFAPHRDRFLLDLRAAVTSIAAAAGVASSATVGPCTMCSRDFASYRRDGSAAGRQLSFVALS
jgi:YfiH family protein